MKFFGLYFGLAVAISSAPAQAYTDDEFERLASCWPVRSEYAGITSLSTTSPITGIVTHKNTGNVADVRCFYRAYRAESDQRFQFGCRSSGSEAHYEFAFRIDDLSFTFADSANLFRYTRDNRYEDELQLIAPSAGAVVGRCKPNLDRNCSAFENGVLRQEVWLPIGDKSVGVCVTNTLNELSREIPERKRAAAIAAREAELERTQKEQERQAEQARQQELERDRLLGLCPQEPKFVGGPWFGGAAYRDAASKSVRLRSQAWAGKISESAIFSKGLAEELLKD